jgi:hypothetical protein
MSQIFPLVNNFDDGSAAGIGPTGPGRTEYQAYVSLTSADHLPGRMVARRQTGAGFFDAYSDAFFYGSTALGSNNDRLVPVVYQNAMPADVTVRAVVRVDTLSGSFVPEMFRRVGVIARVRGGSYSNGGTQNAAITGFDAYAAVLEETAAYPAFQYKLKIIRYNAGSATVVAESAVLDPVDATKSFGSSIGITLSVTTTGAQVDLTASIDGVVFAQSAGGSGVTGPIGPLVPGASIRTPGSPGAGGSGGAATGGPFTGGTGIDGRIYNPGGTTITLTAADTSASRVLGQGRCGVLGQREIAYGNITALMSCDSLAIKAGGVTLLRDEWRRSFPTMAKIAQRTYSLIVYDIATRDQFALQDERGASLGTGVVPGASASPSRLVFDASGTGLDIAFPGPDGVSAAQTLELRPFIPPRREFGSDYTINHTFGSASPASTDAYVRWFVGGMSVRFAAWQYPGEGIWYSEKVGGSNVIIAVAPEPAGMSLGTAYDLRIVSYLERGAEQTYQRVTKVFVDGTQVSGWDATHPFVQNQQSGLALNIDNDGTIRSTNPNLTAYPVEAPEVFFHTEVANAPNMSIASMTEVDLISSGKADPESNPDGLPAYLFPTEKQGATGTLVLDYEFAIVRKTKVRRDAIMFDNGQTSRLLGHVIPRRVWEIGHDSMEKPDADAWQSFWESHRNEVPFTWTAYEDGASGTYRFVKDSFMLDRIGPVYSMRVEIEELLA